MTGSTSMAPQGGDRFEFGENWTRFLRVVDEERIQGAEDALSTMLDGDVEGRSFLDVGSGSGLSSLAAVRLGARRVHAFDFDRASVGCTLELRRRYAPSATHWTAEQGDVLDVHYVARLGRFDIVYSWGVLHHTGDLWAALERVAALVAPGGRLALALYRDQGAASRFWLSVKKTYNRSAAGRALVLGAFVPAFFVRGLLVDIARLRNPAARYREYKAERGMSRVHDWVDWLGGLPYEPVSSRAVTQFYERRGFELARFVQGRGPMRLHEYVFRMTTPAREPETG
jgi:2-polyprenyl-3-methyl-5-hydroxy-6-metoxy-1,4-benzoquinol methylase